MSCFVRFSDGGYRGGLSSKDCSAEFKQRFADRHADGATIAMLQHEFGLAKSTVKLWGESTEAASGP